MEARNRRIASFIVGGLVFAIALAIGISSFSKSAENTVLVGWIVLGVFGFTLSSCFILDNNVIWDCFTSITEWGFVRMPGLIFELDLDGILWFLTVKLLFWILGMILAIICTVLAFIISAFCSVFVYPFALYKNIVRPNEA